MYLAIVALTMFILPIGAVLGDHLHQPAAPLLALVGKWFVFWSVGVRLGLAGLRQFIQPGFTAREIFHMESEEALPLVRELGVANLASGVVGLLSIAFATFTLPVAISSGLFYGIAGVRHLMEPNRSVNENVATVSDLFLGAVLTAYVVGVVLRKTL